MAIMADKQIIALVIALNAIAAGVLYNRFNDHPLVQTFESKVIEYYHTIVPPKVADRCGALKWEEFIIVSNRVVTPEGVGPAAGQHSTHDNSCAQAVLTASLLSAHNRIPIVWRSHPLSLHVPAVRIRGKKIVAIEPWREGQQLNLSHVLNFKCVCSGTTCIFTST